MHPQGESMNDPSETESEYEAPRVETVLTADDVEREALYGGVVSTG